MSAPLTLRRRPLPTTDASSASSSALRRPSPRRSAIQNSPRSSVLKLKSDWRAVELRANSAASIMGVCVTCVSYWAVKCRNGSFEWRTSGATGEAGACQPSTPELLSAPKAGDG
jgi:hypothetical protein